MIMTQKNIITANEYLTLAKGLQEIQTNGLKYKSLEVWLYFSKYKVQKRLGGDGKPHPSIEIKIFISSDSNPISYSFYDWNKKDMVLDYLHQMEYDLKNYRDITKIIRKITYFLSKE